MNKRQIGAGKELLVCEYLKKQGYEILEQNYRNRSGEIDIIARDKEYLVFIEVKYRSRGKCGNPAEAVDMRKQRVISKVALYYCMSKGLGLDIPMRFDVVAVKEEGTAEEIELLKNAFEYSYR